MSAPTVWWEFTQGRYRLCFAGRVPGVTSRGTHLYATRSEVEAALAAALGLAAGDSPLAPAVVVPALPPWRGDPALDADREPAPGRPAGASATGVALVPAPQAPAGAVPHASGALVAGHLSASGADEWTRPAAGTTGRDLAEINPT